MEKIIITPNEVRALGNIVSPKSKNDFLGSKISQGTATVQGIPSTVYTSTYLPISKLTVTGEHYLQSDKTLKLNIRVQDNHNNPIRSGTVYCTVQNRTYTATIKSNGTCTLNITGLTDGLHTLKIYYPGTSSIGGSFRDFTVVVGEDLVLELFCTNGLVQPGEYSELFGILSSMGIGVPGVKVDFYEEFILSFIKAYASKPILQIGETVDINARVSDIDGSGIAEQLVKFYEEFDITFILDATPSIIQTDEYSEITVQLRDVDGSAIQNQLVKFYEEYEASHINVYANTHLIQTGSTAEIYSRVSDEDGSAIPGMQVKFYEYYDYSDLIVNATSTLIQTGDTTDISARLSDADGSAIPDTLVNFYEYYDLTSLRVSATANPIQTNDTTDISAVLKDEDGSLIRDERVDFSKNVDSADWSMTLNEPDDLIQTDDTIDITATVKDSSNNAVQGIYVRFYYTKEE